MKILYLTNDVPWPVNNGKRMRIFSFLRSLSSEYEVHLVCLNQDISDQESFEPLLNYVNHIEILQMPAGKRNGNLSLRIQSLFAPLPYTVYRFKSKEIQKKVQELSQNCQYKIIICDGLHMSINVPPYNHTMTILNEQNIEYMILKRYIQQERNLIKKIYAFLEMKKLERFERLKWEEFSYCVVCSPVDRDLIHSYDGNIKVAVIPNTIDVQSYETTMPEIPYNISYMGGLDWFPNQDAVTFFYDEIYDKIKHELPQISFTVIGRNPPDKIIHLERFDSSVRVTGTVEDIRPFVAESQIVVVPLRMGSGTRLKILEAMAMRKPVVSTSIGAEGLEVTNYKDILIADDPKEFAMKVIELLTDGGLRTRIVDNAFNLVRKEYDIGVVKEKLGEVFAHLTGPHLQ